MEKKFSGKRALVTGAGRGIGRAVAIELAKQGAHVIALSRTKEHLETLKDECKEIEIVSVDISNWKETEIAVKKLGPIDLLVNNAGVGFNQEVGSVTEEAFDETFAVNVKAALNISQIVANGMKERGSGGSIVNMSSQAGIVALPKHATYCASKGALDQLTKVFALELGPYQIRVNSLNPTVVWTDMGIKAWGEKSVAQAMMDKIPLGKFCDPDDVVKATLFLLSDDSRMITGVQLPIDGIGRSIVIELVKRGAHVIALSRTKEHLNTLKQEVPQIEIVSADVSNWKETENVIKQLGDIDLLVNNAGIISLQEVGSITEEEIDNCFAVNVKAVVNISQIVASGMKARGTGGSIVNISSQAAIIALPRHATYCASKGALDQITKVMALELGPHKIRVNSINPTVVLTDMGVEAIKSYGDPETVTKALKAKIPLGDFCEVEDVIKATLFLLSENSRMITGVQLPLDGGYIIQ